jgi:hypothetical protein
MTSILPSRRVALLSWVILLAGCDGQGAAELAVAPLASPAVSAESADPALAVDPSTGDLLLSWVGGDSSSWSLYFARSGDQGTTWSAPALVAGGGREVHPHGESSPRLVAGPNGLVALAWVRSIEVPGRRWPATEMRAARSSDGGASWSAPVTLNDDTAGSAAGHQFHGAAWSGDSALVVSWLDERAGAALEIHHGGHSPTAGDVTDEPDAVIFTATSPNFGRTWSHSNALMWGEVCPCCRVTLARGPDGTVVSAWRKHYPGNIRDVVTAPVGDGPPADPARVNQDNWVYPGCPHTGPGIAVDAGGARHVVWYVGKEGSAGVYYQRVSGQAPGAGNPLPLIQAHTMPAAHTTVAALSGGRALAAYDMTAAGDRAVSVTLISADGTAVVSQPLPGSEGGQYPQVVATGPGTAVVAWIGKNGDRREIRLAAIRFEPDSDEGRVALRE